MSEICDLNTVLACTSCRKKTFKASLDVINYSKTLAQVCAREDLKVLKTNFYSAESVYFTRTCMVGMTDKFCTFTVLLNATNRVSANLLHNVWTKLFFSMHIFSFQSYFKLCFSFENFMTRLPLRNLLCFNLKLLLRS